MTPLETAMAKIKAEGDARKKARSEGLPEPATEPAISSIGDDLSSCLGMALLIGFVIGLVAMVADCSTTTSAERYEAQRRDAEISEYMAKKRETEQIRFDNARIGCAAGVLEACRQYRDMAD